MIVTEFIGFQKLEKEKKGHLRSQSELRAGEEEEAFFFASFSLNPVLAN